MESDETDNVMLFVETRFQNFLGVMWLCKHI